MVRNYVRRDVNRVSECVSEWVSEWVTNKLPELVYKQVLSIPVWTPRAGVQASFVHSSIMLCITMLERILPRNYVLRGVENNRSWLAAILQPHSDNSYSLVVITPMNCAFSTIMSNLGVTLCTLWPTCDISIETAIEWRKMKIFQIRLRLQRGGKHLRLKTSSIQISIWPFYFSVSITPIWTLVQNVTLESAK